LGRPLLYPSAEGCKLYLSAGKSNEYGVRRNRPYGLNNESAWGSTVKANCQVGWAPFAHAWIDAVIAQIDIPNWIAASFRCDTVSDDGNVPSL
jgi:hypothetical protein